MKQLCCLAVLLGLLRVAAADVVRVQNTSTDLQVVIDEMQDGDTLSLGAGVFMGPLHISGKSIVIVGEGRDQTIIDGAHTGSALSAEGGEGSFVAIAGIGFRNGAAESGGGLFLAVETFSVERCAVYDNAAVVGGGIFVSGTGVLQVVNCRDNIATSGGGIAIAPNAQVLFKKSTVSENRATVGGGMFVSPSVYAETRLDLQQCTMEGNTADVGGAVSAYGSVVVIDRCELNANFAERKGGGLHADDLAQLAVNESELRGNMTSNLSGAVSCGDQVLAAVIDSEIVLNLSDSGASSVGVGPAANLVVGQSRIVDAVPQVIDGPFINLGLNEFLTTNPIMANWLDAMLSDLIGAMRHDDNPGGISTGPAVDVGRVESFVALVGLLVSP